MERQVVGGGGVQAGRSVTLLFDPCGSAPSGYTLTTLARYTLPPQSPCGYVILACTSVANDMAPYLAGN